MIDCGNRLDEWAGFLAEMARRGVKTLLYINNHYAGHAPATAQRLMAKMQGFEL